MIISSFSGDYDFLSNFYPAEVVWKGQLFPTVEHAYQAAKSNDPNVRLTFSKELTAGQAKRLGRTIDIRPDWEDIKLTVMSKLLWQKFNNVELGVRLRNTKPAILVEGNWWGDKFWGVCRGEGHNHLGKLLMELRDNDLF